MRNLVVALLFLAGCSAPEGVPQMPGQPGTGAGGNGSTTGGNGSTTGGNGSTTAGGAVEGPTLQGPLTFAVFGDSRPPNPNDTTGYPTAVVQNLFTLAKAKGAQLIVGTGDYMFASTSQAVNAQLDLYMQGESLFGGPVYHALGNHECNGYTNSNCPNLTETPNIQAFMSRMVPTGVTQPYYRVDVTTPAGKAKFLFIAANAWSSAQGAWLQAQLADQTTYTFVVRHEQQSDTQVPGVGPSESLVRAAPYTLELLGHTHEYRRLDTKHVISGNGGAPLTGGGSFGLLVIAQQPDGTLTATEYDQATGNATDSWRITADGQDAP